MATVSMEAEYKAFLKELGKRIREIRKAKGFSLRNMVVDHGYADSQWRKYESGGSGLTMLSLLRIAALFEMSLSALLDGLACFPAVKVETVKKSARLKQPAKKAALKKRG